MPIEKKRTQQKQANYRCKIKLFLIKATKQYPLHKLNNCQKRLLVIGQALKNV